MIQMYANKSLKSMNMNLFMVSYAIHASNKYFSNISVDYYCVQNGGTKPS